jgi:divalent metal cation (Fe/Co/Zn/Cd) transporter
MRWDLGLFLSISDSPLGLGANALFGWWWADPVAAFAMVYFLIKEGREAVEEGWEGLVKTNKN